MRTLMLTALCILAGCGTAPPESAPVASSTVLAATPQNTASEAAVPAPQNTAETAVPADKNRKFKPPAGYKAKIVGWEILYCRKTVVLGSRFPTNFCMTEAELKAHLARNEEMRDELDQGSRTCSQSAASACGMN